MELMPQSPSSVGVYNTCPKQYEAKYITKEVKFVPNKATERGSRLHNLLELRVKENVALPHELKHFENFINKVTSMSGEVKTEFTLAISREFKPCDYKDRYIGGKIDLGIINHDKRAAMVFDYKTGKVKNSLDFQFQLLVYATMVLINYPHITKVRTYYVFLDHCELSPTGKDGKPGMVYTREDLDVMQAEIAHQIERIRHATEKNEWIPNPGGLCRANKPHVNGGMPWCQVKSCPFWNK